MVLQEATLVLNRNWVPIDVTTVLNALCKVYEGAARVVKPDDYTIHDFDSWASLTVAKGEPCVKTGTLSIPVPEVIVLARYGKIPNQDLTFSRWNLYKRDRYTCQYCGKQPRTEDLSIDHVIPRARGGKSTWTNCVLACMDCNAKKASCTPEDVGLKLRREPAKPRWTPRLVLARIRRKVSWEQFLSHAYWNVELQE